MLSLTRILAGFIAPLALAACGGSSTATATAIYQTFVGTDVGTSTIGGRAIKNGQVVTLSGSYQHDTGATVVADGTYTLTDTDGFDSDGELTDGTSTIRPDDARFNGTYDFARPFMQTGAGGLDVFGVVGLQTAASDIPSANTAVFTGEAVGILAANGQGIEMNDGTSRVVADFGAGRVTVTLSDFTMVDQMTNATITGPIDEIVMTNMTISGSGFQSGSITTRMNGAVVDIIGASPTRNAAGTFFGITPDESQPDEAGGAVRLRGDDGEINALFIANAQ